ncbi:MAG: flagellar basal body rod protein FlgC, partial [Brevinematales bacterium]
MGMFDVLNISGSGLTAQRLRLDVIANNIANATSTRTTEGGPFQRSRVVLRPINDRLT